VNITDRDDVLDVRLSLPSPLLISPNFQYYHPLPFTVSPQTIHESDFYAPENICQPCRTLDRQYLYITYQLRRSLKKSNELWAYQAYSPILTANKKSMGCRTLTKQLRLGRGSWTRLYNLAAIEEVGTSRMNKPVDPNQTCECRLPSHHASLRSIPSLHPGEGGTKAAQHHSVYRS